MTVAYPLLSLVLVLATIYVLYSLQTFRAYLSPEHRTGTVVNLTTLWRFGCLAIAIVLIYTLARIQGWVL